VTRPIENAAMVAARIDTAVDQLHNTINWLEDLRRLVVPPQVPAHVDGTAVGSDADRKTTAKALLMANPTTLADVILGRVFGPDLEYLIRAADLIPDTDIVPRGGRP